MPAVKSNNGLKDELNVVNESRNLRGQSKRIFWQTSINEQRPQLRVCVNGKLIAGLLDTGADVSIITPESWHPHWPLQEVDIQFLGIGTLSRVRQSTRWVNCIGPDGQIGKLRPYVANIAVNLWGSDLLQQWNTQINIPAASRAYISEDNITRYYRWQKPAIRAIQDHNTLDGPSEVPTVMPLK